MLHCAVQPSKCITRRSIAVHNYFGTVMVTFSNFNSINMELLLRVRHANPLPPIHQNNAERALWNVKGSLRVALCISRVSCIRLITSGFWLCTWYVYTFFITIALLFLLLLYASWYRLAFLQSAWLANSWSIWHDTDHLFQLLQKIIHFSSFYCFGIRNCQNVIKSVHVLFSDT